MYSTTTTLTNGTLIDNAAFTTVGDSHEEYNFMGTINLAPNANYISNRRFVVGSNWTGSTWNTTINGTGTNGSVTWGGDAGGNQNFVGVLGACNLNINGGTVNFNNASYGTGNGTELRTLFGGTIKINGGNMNVGTVYEIGRRI